MIQTLQHSFQQPGMSLSVTQENHMRPAGAQEPDSEFHSKFLSQLALLLCYHDLERELRKRDKHALRFKSGFPAVEHLIMHELFHLKLVIDARKEQINQLFTSTSEKKRVFESDYSKHGRKMVQNGYSCPTLIGQGCIVMMHR